ncbi:uncharacterized protein LOC127573281 [Pristis pectinata]|uniref:uncharacterized protein LOC127573281 n=1 Tax=Pristis pectinata TaxID=685728 RepID=UPI00223CE52C|nr:uncharacterized protein LOC127573281 [Pristis pectinata]
MTYTTAAEIQRSKPENPLLDNEGLPRFSAITAEHIIPGITKLVQEHGEGLQELEKNLEAMGKLQKTWSSVFDKLEILQFPIHYSWGIVANLNKVKNSPEVRKAYHQVEPLIVKEHNRLSQNVIFYNAYKELIAGSQKLNGAQLRIINFALHAAKNGGAELEGGTKSHFNDIQLQLANLTEIFRNNAIDSTNAYSLLLTDKAGIEDLPQSARRLLASNAVVGTERSPDPENGPWKATLDSPSFKPIMLYSRNRQLKEHLYKAFISRARGGPYDNSVLIDKIRQLRHEIARILGYKNFAELAVSRSMAGSVDKVWEFINVLRDKSFTVAQQELRTLQQFAESHGHEGELKQWDRDYWDEQQSTKLFSVLSGLFQLSLDLFGIVIKPADLEVEVWHPDVRVFNVYDKKGSHVASFFIDLYSRPNEKERGSWTAPFISKSNILHKKPVAFLVCNQVPPVGSIPSLMSFSEIKALFHEFGHALQHMLTTVPYVMAAGLKNIEWDAIEFPSQFMENWVYDNNTIALISGHYQTGEPLPQSIFEQLLKARHYQGGSVLLRQVFLSALDMKLHTSSDSWKSVVEEVAERFTVMKQLPEDCVPCTFLHIFSGNYAATYYAYEWAEVLSLDAFAAFEEAGLQNRTEISKNGNRFRDTVLSLGGGTHPKEVFRMFRGRDPYPEFLLKAYGLV